MTRRSFSYAWLFGAALLALVVGAALHVSGSHEFIVLAERAGPWWMGLALLLQVETHIAQGVICRKVAAAAGAPLRRTHALALSLAKLFADQALPSGGISGSLAVARALRRRGIATRRSMPPSSSTSPPITSRRSSRLVSRSQF